MTPIIKHTAKKVLSNKYIISTIVTLVVFFFLKGKIRRAIRKFRASRFDKNETESANQLAQQYRAAANPSALSWMIDIDGTDEKAVERLAYQSKRGFEDVADVYKQKFDETLTDRMRKELNADEFQDWKNIID